VTAQAGPRDGEAGEPARDRARRSFEATFGGGPAILARAPGRVSLIGGHVDYSGGFVLPAAIDRDLVVAARGRDEPGIRVIASDMDGETDQFVPGDPPPGGWRSYVRGVAALIDRAVDGTGGADLAIAGDVPRGVGLASSAALEVAVATALLALADREMPGPELATLCRRAEVEWAGVECGIMDQFVAVMARAGHALLLDARSLEHRHVPVPPDARVIATESGIRRQLESSAFNDRVEATRRAAELLGVPQLRDIPPDRFHRESGVLPEPVRSRAHHVVEEIQRTRDAARALEAGAVEEMGRLMRASHESSRSLFESSIPELDILVDAAMDVDGVYGSRLTGAGWGGCTVSLLHAGAVEDFVRAVTDAYRTTHGREPVFHVCRIVAGAGLLQDAPGD
jgi:galactokinase